MVRPVTSARLVTALVQEAHAGEPAAFGDAAIPPTIAIRRLRPGSALMGHNR
jgi:hypothetical protein